MKLKTIFTVILFGYVGISWSASSGQATSLGELQEQYCTLYRKLMDPSHEELKKSAEYLEFSLKHAGNQLFIQQGNIHNLHGVPWEADCPKREANQYALNAYNFLCHDIRECEKLDFLRQFLPDFKEGKREKDWCELRSCLESMTSYMHSLYPSALYKFWEEQEGWKKNIFVFAGKVLEHVSGEDTLVAVGNTPQFVVEGIKCKSPNLKIIQVALSGWPDKEKQQRGSWIKSIVTPAGIETYCQYLDSVGLNSSLKGKIFFLDLVGGGGGPDFLINLLIKFYPPAERPDITLIALNKLDPAYIVVDKAIPVISLDPDEEYRSFLGSLDRVSHDKGDTVRFTPDFPAWRWESWKPGEFSLPVGSGAVNIVREIKEQALASNIVEEK